MGSLNCEFEVRELRGHDSRALLSFFAFVGLREGAGGGRRTVRTGPFIPHVHAHAQHNNNNNMDCARTRTFNKMITSETLLISFERGSFYWSSSGQAPCVPKRVALRFAHASPVISRRVDGIIEAPQPDALQWRG